MWSTQRLLQLVIEIMMMINDRVSNGFGENAPVNPDPVSAAEEFEEVAVEEPESERPGSSEVPKAIENFMPEESLVSGPCTPPGPPPTRRPRSPSQPPLKRQKSS